MIITPVTKKICNITIFVFMLQILFTNELFEFALYKDGSFRVYQLITHIFMHGGIWQV